MNRWLRSFILGVFLVSTANLALPETASAAAAGEDDWSWERVRKRIRNRWKRLNRQQQQSAPEVDPRHAGALVVTLAGGAYLILRRRNGANGAEEA